MKDQVIIGPNGQLGIAIPLFRWSHETVLEEMGGYSIAVTNNKPIAYVIDAGEPGNLPIINAEFVEKNAIFLGDL